MKNRMETFRIAVLPGDGIGPEVVRQTVKVLQRVSALFSFQVELKEAPIGGAAFDLYKTPLPEDTLKLARNSEAVLLGAVGGPKWDNLPVPERPEQALLGLRAGLGLFANLRPACIYPPLSAASPLKPEIVRDVDIMVVRELTGGLYFGRPRGIRELEQGEVGINTLSYQTFEIERIARTAFDLARGRRKKVSSVDKANVLESSQLWRKVVTRVHKDYPEIELEHIYVDNCAMQLIREPRQFDVLLTGNIFGDILSDEAAMLTGSIGMLASASLGGKVGLFEPVHGSAPDLAGKDLANPLATIISLALLLEYGLKKPEAARRIEKAVNNLLQKGYRSKDIYTPGDKLVGTKEMGELVLRELG